MVVCGQWSIHTYDLKPEIFQQTSRVVSNHTCGVGNDTTYFVSTMGSVPFHMASLFVIKIDIVLYFHGLT
jgi:hypothetical protein